MNTDSFVNSLQRGLTILEAFTLERPRLKLQELRSTTGIPKTTVPRLFRTLASLGYIRLDSVPSQYFLGPRVMSLGFATLSSLDLKQVARPYLEELSRTNCQNVNLGIPDGTEVVYIERNTRRHLITADYTVGSRLNMSVTAIGRAILANLGQKEARRIVKRILPRLEPSKELRMSHKRFLDMLGEVRHKGFSVNNEEFIPGVRAIGATIFNS